MRSPASSGSARGSPRIAAHQRRGNRARGRCASGLPRQDARAASGSGAADRDRSLPRRGERRRRSAPASPRRPALNWRSSIRRPRRAWRRPAAPSCSIPKRRGVILFDIGGGSSELVRLGRSGPGRRGPPAPEIVGWISLPVGVVTLAERYGGDVVSRETYEAMIDEVASFVAKFADAHACELNGFHMLGTSGTVTTIAGVHLRAQAIRPPPRRRLLDVRRTDIECGR